jgi:hypothetical protein
VPSCQQATRAARLERWCEKCNIHDITFVALEVDSGLASETEEPSDVSARLRSAVRDPVLPRTRPGDTWVFLFADLDLPPCLGDSREASEAATREALGGDAAVFPFHSLPAYVTIVCLADSSDCLERLGLHDTALSSLGERTFRMVSMLLISVGALSDESEQKQRRDLCASAMLRAADALSLSDGPCSLTCDDFFQEFSDQALGLATSGKSAAPQAVLCTYPQDTDVANKVRWPIAAVPRNSIGTKVGTGESLWTLSPSLREPAPAWRRSEDPPAPEPIMTVDRAPEIPSFPSQLPRGKSPAASKYEPRSLLPRASWSSMAKAEVAKDVVKQRPEASQEPRPPSREATHTTQEPRPPSREARRQIEGRHRSSSRGMPTSLGGLSAMLTGGLKEAPQPQKPAKEQSSAGAQQRRGSSTRRRQKPVQDHDDFLE